MGEIVIINGALKGCFSKRSRRRKYMSKKRKKVLVVDDNPTMQKITERLLTRNGYKTVACWYGEECVNRAKAERPDVIIMDVILPDGDGKEFAKQLMEDKRTKDIPIIFATNTVDLEDDKGYEVFNINGVLYRAFAKPLHNQKVVSVIRKEINRKKFGGELPKEAHQYQNNKVTNESGSILDQTVASRKLLTSFVVSSLLHRKGVF